MSKAKIDPPSSLIELQTWFASIITQPLKEMGPFKLPIYSESIIRDIQKKIAKSSSLQPEQRIGIYNQQYWWRLFSLLQDYYPGIFRLFGHLDFNEKLAKPYFLQHPPIDYFLPNIAMNFPQWVESSYLEEDRLFILQMAKIDEAYVRLLHSPSYGPIEMSAFNVNQPIYLQPTVDLFCMHADFFAFREKLLKQDVPYWTQHDFPELDTSKTKYFFMLQRLPNKLQYQELSEAQYLLLSTFKTGANLLEACSKLESNPKLSNQALEKISEWFYQWATLNILTHIRLHTIDHWCV